MSAGALEHLGVLQPRWTTVRFDLIKDFPVSGMQVVTFRSGAVLLVFPQTLGLHGIPDLGKKGW